MLPPVAVLSDPFEPSPGQALSQEERVFARRAIDEIDRFSAFVEPQARNERLCNLLDALEQLDLLVSAALVSSDRIPPGSAIQRYFRIRTAQIDARASTATAVQLVLRSIEDMRVAPISGTTIMREIFAIRQVLKDAGSGGLISQSIELNQNQCPAPIEQKSERWYYRWILAHQVHALFNVKAALAIGDAIESLKSANAVEVSEHLERAVVYVHGFSAARAHALAIPPSFYNEVLRPSMTPPLSDSPLSGRMHVEYRSYRTRLAQFLEILPQSIQELAEWDPRLALTRELLLEADLTDAENHVCLVEPVVGQTKSLVQSARSPDSAVSMLRRIRDRRTEAYGRFMRGGSIPRTVEDPITPR